MEMRLVTYFMATAEYRDLSKAADHLLVFQSTLSQFLAKEEQELGVKLVSRNRSKLTLTYVGGLYEEARHNMMELQSSLYKRLSDIEQSRVGHISIGIAPQQGGEIFVEIYPIFKQRYPNCLVNPSEDITEPLLKQVVKGALDTAILVVTNDVSISLPNVSMSREELVFAVPASSGEMSGCQRWLGTALKTLDTGKAKNEDFIISCLGIVIQDITNSVFEQYRISPRIICEINNHSSLLRMVTSGLGVAVILFSYVDGNPHVSYFSIEDGIFWNICTVTKRNFKPCKPDHYLMNLMGEYFMKERVGN